MGPTLVKGTALRVVIIIRTHKQTANRAGETCLKSVPICGVVVWACANTAECLAQRFGYVGVPVGCIIMRFVKFTTWCMLVGQLLSSPPPILLCMMRRHY